MATFGISRGLVSGFLCCFGFPLTVAAQTTIDATGAIGTRPSGWTSADNLDRLRLCDQDTFFTTDASPRSGFSMMCYSTGGGGISQDYYELTLSGADAAGVASATALLSWSIFMLKDTGSDADEGRVGVQFVDSNQLAGSVVWFDVASKGTSDVWVSQIGASSLSVPATTSAIRFVIQTEVFSGSTPNIFWDDAVYTLTYDDTGDTGGTGGTGDTITTETPYDPVTPQDIADAAQEAYDFVCGDSSELSAVGFIPDAWGGAGIGGQIAQIVQGLQSICLQEQDAIAQEEQITIATETNDALTNPKPFSQLPEPTGWGDASSTDISDRLDNTFGNAVYADDVVTAINRQNEIAEFNMRVRAAEMERIYGRSNARSASPDYDGPLMNDLAVEDDESVDFAERGYGQTKARLKELSEEQGSGPDFAASVRMDLVAAPPVSSEGYCLAAGEVAPPTDYDNPAAAFQVIKYNATMKLASTPVGSAACEILEQSTRQVTDLCFGESFDTPFCLYGSNTPQVINGFWAWFPSLLMIGAFWTVLRMFI